MSAARQTPVLWLIPLSGPSVAPLKLEPKPEGLTLGRHESCELRLPSGADSVSRTHARFHFDNGRWRITDLGSRWGTFLNGVRLQSRNMPLAEGDLIRISPWTFAVSATENRRAGVRTVDDAGTMHTMVRSVQREDAAPLKEEMLMLLLESAAGIHAAADEKELAATVLEIACRGSGLPNAFWLHPVNASGRVEVVASKTAPGANAGAFSRTLLDVASTGVVAELAPGSSITAQSIVELRITSALCVPLMLGPAVAGYVYLDSRSGSESYFEQPLKANASAFCLALGRIASLALANLKRIEIERRQAQTDAEISAAAEAQRWILPRREGRCGPFSYVGESRPGQHMAGDFFDVIRLDEHRVAVTLGDVTGKGIQASVLMTAAQGFLHAALQEHGDPARAVARLNRYIIPRKPDSRFITLWLGVFDAKAGSLTYIDAGHGYALVRRGDGSIQPLAEGVCVPVGVLEEAQYDPESVPIQTGDEVLIVSDGIVEQPAPLGGSSGAVREQFEMRGVRACIAALPPDQDPIAALFQRVFRHAESEHLADDATAVMVRW